MTDLVAGLCSITLRALTAVEVLEVAARAGLTAIEWGADVHVPPGDLAAAGALSRRGNDLGIAVASYGSYLGVGPDDPAPQEVERVLDTAEALGTSVVRAWTTLGITPDSPVADRTRTRDRTTALSAEAASRGFTIALEFHPGTLTHTAAATNELLDEGAPGLRTHWQPDPTLSPAEALAELRAVLPRLASLHVFCWGPGGIDDRRPLAQGADLWPRALALAAAAHGGPGPRYALCEFVRGDDPEQLVDDAATLRGWIDSQAG